MELLTPCFCQGATALHAAAHQGHSHLIQALGKVKHVELNAVDNNGRTALHYAAAKGHNAVVSDLWTLGCNLELTDNVGWTGESTQQGFRVYMASRVHKTCDDWSGG